MTSTTQLAASGRRATIAAMLLAGAVSCGHSGGARFSDNDSSTPASVPAPNVHRARALPCAQAGGPTTCDKCFADADCDGGVCSCGDVATVQACNSCVFAACRLDSACGGDGGPGFCSPSPSTGPCASGYTGYYCHTSADRCLDGSNCAQGGTCVFMVARNYWECSYVGGGCP